MDSFVMTWRELLIVVAVVLAIYVAEMLLLLRSGKSGEGRFGKPKRDQEDFLAQKVDRLEVDLDLLRQRLAGLEASLTPAGKPGGDSYSAQTPYSQAVQLAREGRDASDVASSCGISRGEAELIVAMHRARQT